jgi:hypothetical protein
METTHPLPTLTRLTEVIEAFLATIWNYRMPRHGTAWGTIAAIEYTIIARVSARMRHAERALKSLMAQFRAGTLRPAATRKPSTAPRTHTAPKLPPLPRKFAWLCALMPAEAAARGNHLNLLLAEPEMQELLAASPRAIAILKPICNMLAIHPSILVPGAPKLGVPNTAQPQTQAEPPAPNTPGVLPPHHLRILWRPQPDP